MKDPDDPLTIEAARDLAAARAEIRGRRDQVVAEYDERLQQLDALGGQLESGELSAKVTQDRVRQLLGERGAVARPTRAGRTQIGMKLPPTPAAAPTVAIRTGPTPMAASQSISRAISSVDSRIVRVVMQVEASRSRDETRLELALLGGMRRALERQAEALPQDVVLLGSVVDYAEEVQSAINDLEAGGSGRLSRLLDYDRELLSHLVALGGSVAGVKDQIKRAREMLGQQDPNLGQALTEALGAFTRLKLELDRRLPPAARTLFDDIVGP
jgi:hypothetical protein